MKTLLSLLTSLLLLSSLAAAQQITGDYLESRSADIYTGSCFANSEMGLVGDQALLAWRVREGTWDGVRLDGLGIVAAVKAKATLGDPYGNPYPTKAVMIVDDRASEPQRAALISFAQQQGGELLRHVVRVERAPIDMEVLHDRAHHGRALLRAGRFATIETRSLGEKDHLCGNEVTFYPPLTELAHSMPAVALTDAYQGPGLGVSWEQHDKRSAFVGTFAR
jgi:hypothetical protein